MGKIPLPVAQMMVVPVLGSSWNDHPVALQEALVASRFLCHFALPLGVQQVRFARLRPRTSGHKESRVEPAMITPAKESPALVI